MRGRREAIAIANGTGYGSRRWSSPAISTARSGQRTGWTRGRFIEGFTMTQTQAMAKRRGAAGARHGLP